MRHSTLFLYCAQQISSTNSTVREFLHKRIIDKNSSFIYLNIHRVTETDAT